MGVSGYANRGCGNGQPVCAGLRRERYNRIKTQRLRRMRFRHRICRKHRQGVPERAKNPPLTRSVRFTGDERQKQIPRRVAARDDKRSGLWRLTGWSRKGTSKKPRGEEKAREVK